MSGPETSGPTVKALKAARAATGSDGVLACSSATREGLLKSRQALAGLRFTSRTAHPIAIREPGGAWTPISGQALDVRGVRKDVGAELASVR